MARTKSLVIAGVVGVALLPTQWANGGNDDVIYKSYGPNGAVTYGQKPQPEAVRTETIPVQTLTPEQQHAVELYRRKAEAAKDSANARSKDLELRWQKVEKEIRDALAEAERAEAALQKGIAPLPGERIGTARTGGSRFTQDYLDRIQGLELAVQNAKARLDRAYEARNELR